MTLADDVAREALARVLGAEVVSAMRADTPLTAVTTADAIALSVAAQEQGARVGMPVLLTDADLAGVHTLADLTRAIEACSGRGSHA